MMSTIRFRLPGSALAFALGCASASTVGEHHTLGLVLAVTAVVIVADMSIGFQRGKRFRSLSMTQERKHNDSRG